MITFNCGSDNAPAIDYRDRWRTERFSQRACARLQASMLLTGLFGIPFWSPEQSFTMSAWVKPWEFTVWDGVLAVVLAWWVVGVLKGSMPDGVPRVAAIALDLRVLGAAAALSLIVGLLFGVAPALQLSRPDLTRALKDGARGASAGGGKGRVRSALVVVEVALAVILLVGAALFIGSFRELMKIDPGFDPENVLTLSMVPRLEISTPGSPPDHAAEVQAVVDRIRQIPGVHERSHGFDLMSDDEQANIKHHADDRGYRRPDPARSEEDASEGGPFDGRGNFRAARRGIVPETRVARCKDAVSLDRTVDERAGRPGRQRRVVRRA